MNEKHFWFYLLNISESIAAIDPADESACDQLEAQLDNLNEIFRGSLDPVDELEQYTALTLSNSIRKVLAGRREAMLATVPSRQRVNRGTS